MARLFKQETQIVSREHVFPDLYERYVSMKKVIAVLVIVVLLSEGKLFAQSDGWGSVSGRIVFDGVIPVLPNLVEKGAAGCVVKAIPNERIIVGKNGGLKNCFVYLYLRRGKPLIHPDLMKSTQEKVELEAKDCRFVPHSLIVRTDQTINFFSNDIFEHSIHTFPFRNDGVNRVVPVQNQRGIDLEFPVAEPLPMSIVCDLHPWMSANLFVVDHPYAVLTDKNGNFTIEKLPAKTVTFRIWHEVYGYIKLNGKRDIKIDIPDGKTAKLGIIKVPAKLTP